ncbi:MAG: pyridoxamine 5'-phosphate oxidase family protein [Chloroflexota bacterium]
MTEPDTTQIIRAFLETQSTLALATVKANGDPQIAPVFYVSDDQLNLYWLSTPTSRHSANLSAHSKVSGTIYPSVWQTADIVGVQIEGEAQPIGDDRVREQILNLYLRKFQIPAEFDSIINASTLYILTPRWIRWLDNSVQFNYKAEINL